MKRIPSLRHKSTVFTTFGLMALGALAVWGVATKIYSQDMNATTTEAFPEIEENKANNTTNEAIEPADNSKPPLEPVNNAANEESDVIQPLNNTAAEPSNAVEENAVGTDDIEVQEIDVDEVAAPEKSADENEDNWESSRSLKAADISTAITIEQIIEPPSEYHYAAFGKPNPFMPPVSAAKDGLTVAAVPMSIVPSQTVVGGAEIPVINPLQYFPLSQLNLKGIWQVSNGEMRAIVMTPRKEGVIVKVNDPVSAGKVVAIQRDKMVVRQYKIRADGSREYVDVNVFLGETKVEPLRAGSVVKLNPGQDPLFEQAPAPASTSSSAPAVAPTKTPAPVNTTTTPATNTPIVPVPASTSKQ